MNYLQQQNSADFNKWIPNVGLTRYNYPVPYYANGEMDIKQWPASEVYGPIQRNSMLENCSQDNYVYPVSPAFPSRISIPDIWPKKKTTSIPFGIGHSHINKNPSYWNAMSPSKSTPNGAEGIQLPEVKNCHSVVHYNNQRLIMNPQPLNASSQARNNKSPEGLMLGCNFCRRNGERKEFFQGHFLKDSAGNVQCPVLRQHVCELCGQTGPQAHTRAYCPLSNNKPGNRSRPLAIKLKETLRDSCGRIKNSH